MPPGEKVSRWGQGAGLVLVQSWDPASSLLPDPPAGGKASSCMRHPKSGQDHNTGPSPVTSPLHGKQHGAAQVAMSGIPQPAGPPKMEGVLLGRCATVTSTSLCQDGQLCSPRSHPTCWLGALMPQQHVKMGVLAAVCRVSVMNRMTGNSHCSD